jgi:hypothetical protein
MHMVNSYELGGYRLYWFIFIDVILSQVEPLSPDWTALPMSVWQGVAMDYLKYR